MQNLLRTRTTIATVAGLSVVGALAGCSATPAASTGGAGSEGGAASGSGTTSTTSYKDGSYTAPGTYLSPGGTENISVTLTLAKNIITALKVTTVNADPTATGYEQLFEGGIGAVAVGKDINTLNVGVVAGSSLTSMGFDKALDAIKADARG